jgi:uncharacterized protein
MLADEVPIQLLVLQPTPFCNLDCDYCYLPSRLSTRRLSTEALTRILRAVLESGRVGPELSIVWHAGEPLVLPVHYYEQAFAAVAEVCGDRLAVRHSFQTNAVLLSPEWCGFIRRHGVSVGVSLDGPAFIHDRHRRTRSGRGTHGAVMRGIGLLQAAGVDFHVIAVVTSDSLDHPDAIIDFFLAQGIRKLGFNVEEIEGANPSSSLGGEEALDRYRRFLRRLYDRMKQAGGALTIREFDHALGAVLRPRPLLHHGPAQVPLNIQTLPYGIVTVDCEGRFTTFSPELLGNESRRYGDFVIGNLQEVSLEAARRGERFQAMLRDVNAGVDRCRESCEYFNVCGGGAPANKFAEHGTFASGETMYCRLAIQAPIDIVLSDLETSLRRTAFEAA